MIIRVMNDSLTELIYFYFNKINYCKKIILLLTNIIPTNLCLTILQHKT